MTRLFPWASRATQNRSGGIRKIAAASDAACQPAGLRARPVAPGLDGEAEGLAVAMALDGEFHRAPLSRGGAPCGLPEPVLGAIRRDHPDLRDSDDAGLVPRGGPTDAGLRFVLSEAGHEFIAPSTGRLIGSTGASVLAVGEKFPVFDPPALQAHLPPVRAGTGQIDARDRICVLGNPHE